MTTICVISTEPELARSLGGVLPRERYRVVPQTRWSEDLARTSGGVFDAVVLDMEFAADDPMHVLERVARQLPGCPLFVFGGEEVRDWEEDAYLMGVKHVFGKPIRARLFREILERYLPASTTELVVASDTPYQTPAPVCSSSTSAKALEVLRDYSTVLTHSLCADSLLKEFLLFIRRMMGVNRAGVFLRQPMDSFGTADFKEGADQLRPACAIGLVPGILDHFQLSLDFGIGRHLLRHGRILQAGTAEAQRDPDIRKEFELVGTCVAIPVLDRESLVGIAMFDSRLTGEPFTSEELSLLFMLLEQLGLALRNISLHEQVTANHDLMADTLGHLSNGCIVVSHELQMLHVNDAARAVFFKEVRAGRPLAFKDLPQVIGSKVFDALENKRDIVPFKYVPPHDAEALYQISIARFERRHPSTPHAALVLIEDHSQAERLQKLDIEAANLRLVKLMAARLAHEIGNSIASLSTYQQLFPTKYRDAEFRASMNDALTDGVRRVQRLVQQMYFLARDAALLKDSLPVKKLIEGAFADLQKMHSVEGATLRVIECDDVVVAPCEMKALKYAIAEIMLNAVQSNAKSKEVCVRARVHVDGRRFEWLHLDLIDSGPGFSEETSTRGTEPFFTTRNVGVGLGLTVSSKIIETHKGKLEIVPADGGEKGFVRVAIPLLPPSAEDVLSDQVMRSASADA